MSENLTLESFSRLADAFVARHRPRALCHPEDAPELRAMLLAVNLTLAVQTLAAMPRDRVIVIVPRVDGETEHWLVDLAAERLLQRRGVDGAGR